MKYTNKYPYLDRFFFLFLKSESPLDELESLLLLESELELSPLPDELELELELE